MAVNKTPPHPGPGLRSDLVVGRRRFVFQLTARRSRKPRLRQQVGQRGSGYASEFSLDRNIAVDRARSLSRDPTRAGPAGWPGTAACQRPGQHGARVPLP